GVQFAGPQDVGERQSRPIMCSEVSEREAGIVWRHGDPPRDTSGKWCSIVNSSRKYCRSIALPHNNYGVLLRRQIKNSVDRSGHSGLPGEMHRDRAMKSARSASLMRSCRPNRWTGSSPTSILLRTVFGLTSRMAATLPIERRRGTEPALGLLRLPTLSMVIATSMSIRLIYPVRSAALLGGLFGFLSS